MCLGIFYRIREDLVEVSSGFMYLCSLVVVICRMKRKQDCDSKLNQLNLKTFLHIGRSKMFRSP